MPDYIVEMIQREKCGTRSPCSDIKKCVCADQAKRITERAFEISRLHALLLELPSKNGVCLHKKFANVGIMHENS